MLYFCLRPKLNQWTAEELEQRGSALIVDCHSFNSVPKPYENNQSHDRADICLGVDRFHTPDELRGRLQEFFEERGYSVATNEPFAGCLIASNYYLEDRRVKGIMIELNRKLYMNEATGEKAPGFSELKADLLALGTLLNHYESLDF